ncbi:hypothetical protein T265_08164 [Opisthorchis viverrini]|uniref:Uncharacterized protein n=1 Tax=Opisthorchis viverrini TaxID=6198 RepID=A0A074ZA43_OPIVI|nr:hypothetical protein T265_08164 [Opisthorchis viverrini]KER24126.1 hypothetical protein T265_08164 [Opisthorchis viverrini]
MSHPSTTSELTAVVNQPFDVHTYGEYVTPSYFTHCYHWDVLAKPKGEVINLHLTKSVQLIRIGRKNPNPPAPVSPILMSEAEAFGTLLLEKFVHQMAPEGTLPEY